MSVRSSSSNKPRRRSSKRGICPLCGKGGWLDHEHIIPKWASKVLRDRPGRPPGRFITEQWSASDPKGRETRPSARIEQKFWVCVTCNGEMERQIESPAIPVLTPLLTSIRPIARPLSRAERETIARWVNKITLLMPQVHLPPGPLRRSQWDFLRAKGRPAPTVFIWVGAYGGKMYFDTRERHDELGFRSERTGQVEHGVIQTMVLGALVTKTLIYPRTNVEYLRPEVIAFHPDFRAYVVPVWPLQPGDVFYPPEGSFDYRFLLRFEENGQTLQTLPLRPEY